MKYQATKYLLIAALALTAPFAVLGQDVNLNPDINSTGFKLVICDGPDLSGLKDSMVINVHGHDVSTNPGSNPDGYVPCNFKTFMQEAQYLINVMIILGVAAAIIGFSWAGWLYVTGAEKNKSRAKDIFPKLGIGFILMLTAWFMVSQILIWLTGNSNYLTLTG